MLSDPDAVFERGTGQPPPAGPRITVLEDTSSTVHFVIPAKPANAGEPSDPELEKVAGGTMMATVYTEPSDASVHHHGGIPLNRKQGW